MNFQISPVKVSFLLAGSVILGAIAGVALGIIAVAIGIFLNVSPEGVGGLFEIAFTLGFIFFCAAVFFAAMMKSWPRTAQPD